MRYTMRATRKFPKLIVFMVDESLSMGDLYGAEEKHLWVDRCINTAIRNLVWMCDSVNGVRDWVHIVALGYGGSDKENPYVRSLFSEPDWVLPISRIAPALVGKDVDDLALYIESKPDGWTPMGSAMKLAGSIVKDWVEQRSDSPAPVIINVTDGLPTDDESADGPVEKWVAAFDELKTTDGAVLLMNAGVPNAIERLDPCLFPVTYEVPELIGVQRLWKLASPLPEELVANAVARKLLPNGATAEGRRMYVHVSNPAELSQLFDFGTEIANGPH